MGEIGRLTDAYRVRHLSEMPLGLVGKEWEPGGPLFEDARTKTAKAISRLAKTKTEPDGVRDWEVRSWLREKHYGDPSMNGLRAAAQEEVERHG